MNTPTPGAASELLSPALTDEAVDIAVALSVQFPATECPLILDIVRAALLVQHKRNTPAPVTEGAQRGAVAFRWRFTDHKKWHAVAGDPPQSLLNDSYYTVELLYPPPPDRVQTRNPESSIAQPERVEDTRAAENVSCPVPLSHAMRNAGANAAELFFRGSNEGRAGFNAGVAWTIAQFVEYWLTDRKVSFLNDEPYPAAPPTDASGGVTEEHKNAD